MPEPAQLPPVRKIVKLERRASSYASSFALDEIDVAFADGSGLRLVAKDLSPAAMHEGARRARPDFLYDPRREIQIYRRILPYAPAGTAMWYGDVSDEVTRKHRLFLERVDGFQLSDVGEFSIWERTASWIARFHNAFSPRIVGQLARRSRLLVYNEGFYWRWLGRAQRFAARPEARRILDRIARGYAPIVKQLCSMPRTVIHGDFYPCNILIDGKGSDVRICPVDWELAAVGPGLIDLAALMTGWERPEQRTLVRAYQAEVPDGGSTIELDSCRLHLAIRMLGWSDTWTPPAPHARDWVREAEQLADCLQL